MTSSPPRCPFSSWRQLPTGPGSGRPDRSGSWGSGSSSAWFAPTGSRSRPFSDDSGPCACTSWPLGSARCGQVRIVDQCTRSVTHLERGPSLVGSLERHHIDQVDVVHGAVLSHLDPLAGGLALGGALVGRVAILFHVLVLVVGALLFLFPVAAAAVPPHGLGLGHLDAGSNGRTRLLVAVSAAVALSARHTILARALAVGLVADLARGSHGVAVAGLAGLLVVDGLVLVAIVALLAVVAMSAGRVVLALETDAARDATRELVELHVEPASPGVVVAFAGHALVGR